MDDEDTGGVWMTKRQLAEARRITVGSADRLIRRQHWRKEPGNDGRARVLVPPDWASLADPASGPTSRPRRDPTDSVKAGRNDPTADPPSDPTSVRSAISTLRGVVDTLTVQLGREQERADRAEKAANEADQRVIFAESRADAALTRALAAETALAKAGHAEELRKARGILARLRAAVRGE